MGIFSLPAQVEGNTTLLYLLTYVVVDDRDIFLSS